jgi:hypothetical protein
MISPSWFEAIQANIRRYGWQAMAVRLLAVALAALFMLSGPEQKARASALLRVWPVACLFLLWMLDGHYKFMQKKYVDLYHDAEGGVLPDLAFKVEDHFNVASLWRPLVMAPYAVLIGLAALAGLGF